MKVLTIKKPWATLIINGNKQYEFRSWKTNYRGKILIHAGLGTDPNIKVFDDYHFNYMKGAIIGEAIITDCILVDGAFDKQLKRLNPLVYQNEHIGFYAWKLDHIKKYDQPIYIKGKLGLWNYESE